MSAHRVQITFVAEMVDSGEEVGFHFLGQAAELEVHARIPNMPAADLLLKWTPINLQNTFNLNFKVEVGVFRFLVSEKILKVFAQSI